ncbi:undecaprenyl/decaprenyl-phosphate alpha-N-acetyl glucosaminyl 1-phosphate transferase [Desulfonema ishimotonii]|uniref:Undecaprenyl/decaprenyl-phosphate alpha-N-acetyl glucosaminyl 1-phosphate transferase n=1 Tax=Desulfonema ishimotonii TaxID=45657 RepID=A0A401FZ36_9BACT|nr:MraY family glycosyltransferase [Desulfonema ishimotonii]GBC62203.1 undecaprenyl/decaprenyl-phosphate alpha-N-acetyl glucosaminyl 1-phosphate transferase [Desulfonema ishimotonii]
MTSIIGIFFVSLLSSLMLTPLVAQLARKYNIVDQPSARKVHTRSIPRAGGVAICLAFFLPFGAALAYPTRIFELLTADGNLMIFAMGAFLAFFLGLWDDIRRLDAKFKFAVQILIALIAYASGLKIQAISVFNITPWDLGFFSLPVTVFWFLLVTNAINLIDGLDGLAAGISLFVSVILLVICITSQRYLVAMGFAALCGATLGFLRYNFNPASIFMGDSGSYFLGYMLAGLSIMGSLKGPATVAILIPVIALGIPLMDVLFAPVRRFILGKKLFLPDKNHLHHRLLQMGFTHRNAVLLLYSITIITGILAIVMVHAKNDDIALILFILGSGVILGIRKLGYMNYIGMNKVQNWFRDVTDEMGISQGRRSFLSCQVEISESPDMNSLWDNVCKALDTLDFDMAEMHLEKTTLWQNIGKALCKLGFDTAELLQNIQMNDPGGICTHMSWRKNGFDVDGACKECLLRMQLPLIGKDGQSFGSIWLIKDLKRDAISHCTLRRVEHLRRSVLGSLQVLIGGQV